MKFVVVLFALIAVSYQQTHETTNVNTHAHEMTTTWPPQTSHAAIHTTIVSTHEPSVNSGIFFHYDYMTHKMSIRYHSMCYIFTLSDQDRMNVHTDSGMKALELKLLPLIETGNKTEVKISSLSAEMQRACRNTTHVYEMI